jgi:hypothetical protein
LPEASHYPRNFIFELRSILYAQMALIPLGILLRGAVTIGDIVQSWGVVYGPGVVRAYEIESRKGGAPVIVIDDETLKSVAPAIEKDHSAWQLDGLVRNEGKMTYLDYLRACENELNVPEQEYSLFLALHRDLIRNGLMKHTRTPILAKYEWLKDYHERTLRERFGSECHHLSV